MRDREINETESKRRRESEKGVKWLLFDVALLCWLFNENRCVG